MELEQIIDIEVESEDGGIFTFTGQVHSVEPNKIVLAKIYDVDPDHPGFPFDIVEISEGDEVIQMLFNQYLSYRLNGIEQPEAIKKVGEDKEALIKLLE